MKKFLKIMGVVLCFAIIVPLILSIGNIFTPGSKGNGTDTSGGIGTGGSDMYTISASACSLTGAALSVNDDIRQAMTFTCNGVEMKGVTISDGKVSFYNDAGTYVAVDNGVVAEEYKVIEIGSSQNVSYEFYKWFIANTQTYTAPVTYELSGVWNLNYNLVPPTESIDVMVNYTSSYSGEDYNYVQIICTDESIEFWHEDYTHSVDFGLFTDRKFSGVIDFGVTPQTVSKEFYTWFTANAEECVAFNGGIYKLNESCGCDYDVGGIMQSVSFVSNKNSYSLMIIGTLDDTHYYGSLDTIIWDAAEGWSDSAYRVVDFGSSVQYVSKTFYNWLITNSIKCEELIPATYKIVYSDVENVVEADFEFNYNGNSCDSFVFSDCIYLYNGSELLLETSDEFTITITSSQYVSKEFFDLFIASTTVVIPEGGYEITPAA